MTVVDDIDEGASPRSYTASTASPVNVTSFPMPGLPMVAEPDAPETAPTLKVHPCRVNQTLGKVSTSDLTLDECPSSEAEEGNTTWKSAHSKSGLSPPAFDLLTMVDAVGLRVEAIVQDQIEKLAPKLIESVNAAVASLSPVAHKSSSDDDSPTTHQANQTRCITVRPSMTSEARKRTLPTDGIRELEACLADIAIQDAGKRRFNMEERRNDQMTQQSTKSNGRQPTRLLVPNKSWSGDDQSSISIHATQSDTSKGDSQAISSLMVSRHPSQDGNRSVRDHSSKATEPIAPSEQLEAHLREIRITDPQGNAWVRALRDERSDRRAHSGRDSRAQAPVQWQALLLPTDAHSASKSPEPYEVRQKSGELTIPNAVISNTSGSFPIVPLPTSGNYAMQAEASMGDSISFVSSEHGVPGSKSLCDPAYCKDDGAPTGSLCDSPKDHSHFIRSYVRQPTNIDLYDQHLSSLAADAEGGFESNGLDDAEVWPFPVAFGFRVVGLLPPSWRRQSVGRLQRLFTSALVFITGTVVCLDTALAFIPTDFNMPIAPNLCQAHPISWTHVPLAISAITGVFTVCGRGHSAWKQVVNVLSVHTRGVGVQERWLHLARHDGLLIFFLVVLHLAAAMTTFFCAGDMDAISQVWGVVVLLSNCIIGILHMSMIQCMLTTCHAVVAMVDNFGNCMVNEPDLSKAILDWKLFQALLRKCTTNIEWTFIGEVAGSLTLLPAVILDLLTIVPSRSITQAAFVALPGAIVFGGVLRLCLVAASISEKCRRVPSLVNALSFGEGTQRQQQYIVEYIVRSSTGFFVVDVKLSMELVLKLLWTWGLLIFSAWSAINKE